jgi:hypothetical protein
MTETGFDNDDLQAFRVPWSRHLAGLVAAASPRLWIRGGNLETRANADLIQSVSIVKPIYIAGLARSGSTILLETIASYEGVGTHRYRDFPFVFTPVWWNRFLDRSRRKSAAMKSRVHADGLLVSSESPEALEEPLWRAFFSNAHAPGKSHVLDASTSHDDFEKFYRNHVQKILALRGGSRYVCKGNYHVARLEYLLTLFPDARFIVPIRNPWNHVASLMKQHRLFVAGETRHPRSLAQMRACGHFEFGLDRRTINCGNSETVASIEQLWQVGEEARGWARYWSHIYGFLADRIGASDALRKAVEFVWFDDLCKRSVETLKRLEAHCKLPSDDEHRQRLAARFHTPSYYEPQFTPAEEATIDAETYQVVNRLVCERSQKFRHAA